MRADQAQFIRNTFAGGSHSSVEQSREVWADGRADGVVDEGTIDRTGKDDVHIAREIVRRELHTIFAETVNRHSVGDFLCVFTPAAQDLRGPSWAVIQDDA